MPQQTHKNHYIPCFYTKRWKGSHDKVYEYSRPHFKLVTKLKSPDSIGFKNDLYTLTGAAPGAQTMLEDEYFKVVDQLASDAIDFILEKPEQPLPLPLRSGFTRLLLSFMYRTPGRVADLRARFEHESDILIASTRERYTMGEQLELPEGLTFEETLDAVAHRTRTLHWGSVLKNAIDSETTGSHLIGMKWFLRRVESSSHTFLTGDRPVVHSNGMGKPEGNIALPLGPRVLFVATNNDAVARNILDVPDDFLVRRVNHEIARLAQSYVYSENDSSLRFVERRLNCAFPPPTPIPPIGYRWPIS